MSVSSPCNGAKRTSQWTEDGRATRNYPRSDSRNGDLKIVGENGKKNVLCPPVFSLAHMLTPQTDTPSTTHRYRDHRLCYLPQPSAQGRSAAWHKQYPRRGELLTFSSWEELARGNMRSPICWFSENNRRRREDTL